MGYKLWATNELLTSSDVNTYLAKQAVIVTTSGSKPTPPVNGMLVFETDTNNYVAYSSTLSAWIVLGKTITGTYTPALTGATTNPNLGTGGSILGRYTLWNGTWCAVRVGIQWGTSGTAGSGQYLISLPFTTNSNITVGVSNVGSVLMRDASAGPALASGVCYAAASSSTMAIFADTSGGVTNAVPWTWGGSGDYITATLTYETA
jgi:hypothetical protein